MIKKECFKNEFIEERAGTNIHRKKIYEKVVHAFHLLEKLSSENVDFIFKGGTSLMLLLNEFNRFSVDIDILMSSGQENNIEKMIMSYVDEVFFKIEEDKRKPVEIIKKHFKFYYNSIYQNTNNEMPYVLLDIVFDDFKYKNLQSIAIESHFVKTTDPLLHVKIPSIDEMLGDKLTAFAPKTIGILYKRENQFYSKHVEIIKQLYDVSKLYDKMEDIEVVKETYHNVANVQIRNRRLSLTHDECLKDSIETCKLLLSDGKTGGSACEYSLLKKGYEGFKNFIVNDFKFQELLVMAAKVYILCIKVLCGKLADNEAKPVNTFIGRKYKYIRQNIGVDLYQELMKACEEEIKDTKVLA